MIFQEVQSFGKISNSWEIGNIKLISKVRSPILFSECPLRMMFQEVWSSRKMHDSWKIGLIMLISKVASLVSFGQWILISLIGGLYNIFAKVIVN